MTAVLRSATAMSGPDTMMIAVLRSATVMSGPGPTMTVVLRSATAMSDPGSTMTVVLRSATAMRNPGSMMTVVLRSATVMRNPGSAMVIGLPSGVMRTARASKMIVLLNEVRNENGSPLPSRMVSTNSERPEHVASMSRIPSSGSMMSTRIPIKLQTLLQQTPGFLGFVFYYWYFSISFYYLIDTLIHMGYDSY
jgi:hypothetical protein